MLTAEEIHALVAARHAEIHERVIAAQLEAEESEPNSIHVKMGRAAILRRFPGILPPVREIASFAPPDLSNDPFAGISVDDLAAPSVEQIDARIHAVSVKMNTPAGRRDPALATELASLRAEKAAIENTAR